MSSRPSPDGEPPAKRSRQTEAWVVDASAASKRFVNPIRAIVDTLKPEIANPDLELLKLSIGDPSVFGNFDPDDHVVESVIEQLKGGKKNGYANSRGYDEARAAVAKFYTCPESPITADDVVLASGCSGALELAMAALADEGKNILLPEPGFSLYKTLASSKGVSTKGYRCLADKGWEIDLDHLESLVDADTVAIVITNPSNPCGSNFSEAHVREIVKMAERVKVP